MKKLYFTATRSKIEGVTNEQARDGALDALVRSPFIEKAEGTIGIFGRLTRRKKGE